MTQFQICFRLLTAFCILTFGTDAVQVSAEDNGSLLAKRQQTQRHAQWENPASMPTVNHAWKNNFIAAGKGVGKSEIPIQTTFARPLAEPLKKVSQQQLLQTNNNVADIIAASVLRFALNVGSELSENAYYSKSEVFSPLSIMSALALLFAGAKGKSYQQLKPIFGFDLNTALSNDPTYAQMLHHEFGLLLQDIEQENLSAMHQRQNSKWRVSPERANIRSNPANLQPIVHIIKVANGLFAQNGYNLNPNYIDVIKAIYNTELVQLDFQKNEVARHYINSWVDKNTFGKIKNVINNAIPQSTNMILASVLYFKGFWENTFFDAATILDNFYPEGEGSTAIKVPMMATGGVFPYYEAHEYGCRIIGLPYRGNLSTMYIIQPMQSNRAKLKDFQNKITPEAIEDLISKMAYRSAVMAFPKLHLVRQSNLKEILQKFGVSDIFSSVKSDLSLIGGSQYNQKPILASASPVIRPFSGQAAHIVRPELMDRFNEVPLFFSSRFGDIGNSSKTTDTTRKATTVKTLREDETSATTTTTPETTTISENETLTTTADEEIVTTTQMPTVTNATSEKPRQKRQSFNGIRSLSLLEEERLGNTASQSDLYVEDIIHKVDFEVNEHGTEAAAATLTYLRRSGTDVIFRCDAPFILLLRHDPTKLVLFYATVNEPEI